MNNVVRMVASMANYDRIVLFEANVVRSGYETVKLWHLVYQTFERGGPRDLAVRYSYSASNVEYFSMSNDSAARAAFMARLNSANPKLVSGMGQSLNHFLVKTPDAVEEPNPLAGDMSGIQYGSSTTVRMTPREPSWSPGDIEQAGGRLKRKKSPWAACKAAATAFLKTFNLDR